MPVYVLSNEHDFDEIILQRRLNTIVFTLCWSLGSKMILPTIFDLSHHHNLAHVNFYRIDIDENNLQLAQRLNIATIPTIQWYFHGKKLEELIGVDLEQFINKTHHLGTIYKHKTVQETLTNILTSSLDESYIFE